METFRTFLVNEAKKESEHEYSCLMADVPDNIARQIRSYGKKIPESYLFKRPEKPGFGREGDPHITILYGIHTDKSSRIRKLLKEIESFEVTLGKVSLFSTNSLYDVIKIDVNSPDLFKLNKMCVDSLYCTQSFHEYSPHLTIAYVNKGRGEKYTGDDTFKNTKFNVTSVTFSSSSGIKTAIKLKIGGEWETQDH